MLTQSGVVRSDIRGSFGGSGSVAAGVPLTLTITLANSNNLCPISLATDNVFGDNTATQLAAETIVLSGNISSGHTGAVTVGVPLS